jgi:hypothetical protein
MGMAEVTSCKHCKYYLSNYCDITFCHNGEYFKRKPKKQCPECQRWIDRVKVLEDTSKSQRGDRRVKMFFFSYKKSLRSDAKFWSRYIYHFGVKASLHDYVMSRVKKYHRRYLDHGYLSFADKCRLEAWSQLQDRLEHR